MIQFKARRKQPGGSCPTLFRSQPGQAEERVWFYLWSMRQTRVVEQGPAGVFDRQAKQSAGRESASQIPRRSLSSWNEAANTCTLSAS